MDRGQTATITAPSGLKVFISYSREDMDFVDELELVLKDKGHEVLIDRHGISAGEEFRNRLEQMIRTCDTVVFVMTDDSLTSDACGWEIDLTKNKYNKRMLVVTLKDISDGVLVPDALAGIDWIHCWRNPRVKDSNPTKGFILLDTALRTDLAWVRKESLIYDDALQWIERGSAPDSPLLLSGELLTDAQAWAREAPDGHAVSPEVDRFIKASAQADARQKAEAEANIAEREKALEDARIAIAAREAESEKARAAIAEQERANARAKRRTIFATGVLGLLIAGAAAGYWYLNELRKVAAIEREVADIAKVQAAEATKEAEKAKTQNTIARAQVIAEAAMNQLEAGDVESATRLAILAFQEGKEADGVASANVALSLIAQEKRAVGFLSGHESSVVKYVPAAWDNLALTLTEDGVLRLWDGYKTAGTFPESEGRLLDVVTSSGLRQIITLNSEGELKSWHYDSELGLQKIGSIETPEPLIVESQSGPKVESATKLTAISTGGLLVATDLQNWWVFEPRDNNLRESPRSSDEVRSSEYEQLLSKQEQLSLFIDEADQPGEFKWSADGSSVALLDAGRIVFADLQNPKRRTFNVKSAREFTDWAIAPDNQHVVVWNKTSFDAAVFSVEDHTTTGRPAFSGTSSENTDADMVREDSKTALSPLVWSTVKFDFNSPIHESDELNIKLHIGEKQELLVLDSLSGIVKAGPLQLSDFELANYTFTDQGRVILIQDFQNNIAAFESETGARLKSNRNGPNAITVSQTDQGKIGAIVQVLCDRLRTTAGRTQLTSEDASAVVILKGYATADVCTDVPDEPIILTGSDFGEGEVSRFSATFERGMEFVLRWEGGFVDYQDNPGGRTNKGITQNTYSKWRANKGLPAEDVLNITDQEVHAIYLEDYWKAVVQNWYPDNLAIALFDSAVNMGPRRAVSMLQHAINETLPGANISVDGVADKTTFDAVRDIIADGNENKLLENYLKTREGVYHRIVNNRPRSAVFLDGWMNRLNDLARFVGADGGFE